MVPLLESAAMAAADAVYALLPRPCPPREQLDRCRLIAHRGAHDGRALVENTLPAFDAARAGGVWGIETDLRWTRDLEPVLLHDADGARLFGEATRAAEVTAAQLRDRLPAVPTLAAVVQRYTPQMHLMLEIKAEPYPDAARQQARLMELLQHLQPGRDYHLMALDPGLFRLFPDVPAHAMIPIARLNVAATSRLALARGYAGIAGHYALVRRRIIHHHACAGQAVGVGFPASRFALYREIARDVRWIYSDRAVELQRMVRGALETAP